MKYQAIIGLEIHVEMKTKSKMFSCAPNAFSREPNTEVALFDMAFPGTLPSVNKQAVINAIRVAHALHMEIDHTLQFDRKNYFYADLPKGYQITQQFHPLGKQGYVDILDQDGSNKRIHIERLHMEEDTCKQLHFEDYTLLDYNRAGVPLVEIVSYPEIRSGYQAMAYVEAIRNIVVYSHTSDGKMEEGSLRCDVNISLRPIGSDDYGTKVEIKNINSLKNIQLALDYEIARQSALLDQGEAVLQETRRFDDRNGVTISMRVKEDAVDYKYFCDPNIPPIVLSDGFIENAISTCPELYEVKLERYLSYGLSKVDAETLLSDIAVSQYFESSLCEKKLAKKLANFLLIEVRSYLHKMNLRLEDLPVSGNTLFNIVKMQEDGYSHQQCVDIFVYICQNGTSLESTCEILHIAKPSADDKLILGYVQAVLDDNPKSIEDYHNGKDRVIGYLIGQVMKLGQGRLNPSMVSKIMMEEIKKR